MVSVHFATVLMAAVAAFIIGFLMHGPVAGKIWMRLANIQMGDNPPKFSSMIPQMLANLIVNIVCAYALAVVYTYKVAATGVSGVWSGVVAGVLVWLGFNLTATVIDVIWMKGSKKLWAFEAIASLVNFAVMGAIIASW